MRPRFTHSIGLISIIAGAALAVGCGGGESSKSSGSGQGGSGVGGAGGAGGDVASSGSGGSGSGSGGGQACSDSVACAEGACIDGKCCDEANACGSVCCEGATACLFGACVTPGKACHTQNDCDDGQYCETGLGDNESGGGAGGGDPACSAPVPLNGKCLDLPPVCDPDASSPAPGCVDACEYRPPVTAKLSALEKWSWGAGTATLPEAIDVWTTPNVGRLHDANCDGKVDELDPPNVVFVSGRSLDGSGNGVNCSSTATGSPTVCHRGALRMIDGSSGKEVWSLDKASDASIGFAGMSTAIGDMDGDGKIDIVAMTGEGYVVIVSAEGKVLRTSDKPVAGAANGGFGWGGGLAIADIDGDGYPEIAFGKTVFTTKDGGLTLAWTGAAGSAGGVNVSLSTFADLDGAADGDLELLAGNTAYKADGSVLWRRDGTPALPDGFSAVGDFDKDGKPEAVLVSGGKVWVLDGLTGATLLGPFALDGGGSGGPPTVADFDGDKVPEIGVATQNYYSVLEPKLSGGAGTLELLWKTANHDLSSSQTGSSVFDFEGDGKAEVIYADECFLWVYDGTTGEVRFGASHSSWTGTEASVVADVDGDGHAEMLMVSNAIKTSQWKCVDTAGVPISMHGYTWEPGPEVGGSYRGVTLFGDKASSWVGTRTLWNQHTYHVSNICDDRDSACVAPNVYGSIPKREQRNIDLPWLNNFRQNVQDKGLFNAPDATVALTVACDGQAQVSIRNAGLSSLPTGVRVGVFNESDPAAAPPIATGETTHPLFPGQTESIKVSLSVPIKGVAFEARVLIDPANPTFHECREDNNTSPAATASCIQ